MTPKTYILLGYDAEEVLNRLPEEIADRFYKEEEIEVDGVILFYLRCGDDPEGLGVRILNHRWYDGSREIDFNALAKLVEELKPKATKIFKSWGINDEPKVLLYSIYD